MKPSCRGLNGKNPLGQSMAHTRIRMKGCCRRCHPRNSPTASRKRSPKGKNLLVSRSRFYKPLHSKSVRGPDWSFRNITCLKQFSQLHFAPLTSEYFKKSDQRTSCGRPSRTHTPRNRNAGFSAKAVFGALCCCFCWLRDSQQ